MPVTLNSAWTGNADYVTNGHTHAASAGSRRVGIVTISHEMNGGGGIGGTGGTVVIWGGQTCAEAVIDYCGGNNVYHDLAFIGYLTEAQVALMDDGVVDSITITNGNGGVGPFGNVKIKTAFYEDVDQANIISASSTANTGNDASNTTTQTNLTMGSLDTDLDEQVIMHFTSGQGDTGGADSYVAETGWTERVDHIGDETNDHASSAVTRDSQANDNALAVNFDCSSANRLVIVCVSLGFDGGAAPVTRSPPAGAMVTTGFIPTIILTDFVVALPGSGALVLTGQVSNRAYGMRLTGFAPVISIEAGAVIIAVPVGSLTITGRAPTVEQIVIRLPAFVPVVITGRVPTMIRTENQIRAPPTGLMFISQGLILRPYIEITVVRAPAQDTLVLAGLAPSIEETRFAVPPSRAVVLTGFAPTVNITVAIAVPRGAMALTGLAPTVEQDITRRPPAGSMALAGFAPVIERDVTRLPPAGALAITGLAPTVDVTVLRLPPTGATALTGLQPTVSVTNFLTPLPLTGSMALTGFAPTIEISRVSLPTAGSMALTGFAPSLGNDITALPPVGAAALTGFAPSLAISEVPIPLAGAMVLTGFAPSIEVTVIRQPGAGALVLSGAQPGVLSGNDKIMQPPSGGMALTGLAPSIEEVRFALPPVGSLALAGQAPTVEISRTSFPPTGAVLITGLAPTVEIDVTRRPPAGSMLLAGVAPSVTRQDSVNPPSITVNLTGLTPTVEITVTRQPGSGSLALAGQAPAVISGNNKVMQPLAGAMALAGAAPTVEIGIVTLPGAGTLALTGLVPSVNIPVSTTVNPPAGSMAITGLVPKRGSGLQLTGFAPELQFDAALPLPPAGSLAITGLAPTVIADITLIPGVGSLILSGQIPSTDASNFSPPTNNLVITTYAPSVQIMVVRQPPTGLLVLTGQQPNPPSLMPGTGLIGIFGHAPIRPHGLKVRGSVPVVDINPIGSFKEFPDTRSMNLIGYAPDVAVSGTVTNRLPGIQSLALHGERPALVTNIVSTDASLVFTTYAPSVHFNLVQTPRRIVAITGFAPILDISIEFIPAGSMAITGQQPILVRTEGARIILPPTGALVITPQRPVRTTQGTGSLSDVEHLGYWGGIDAATDYTEESRNTQVGTFVGTAQIDTAEFIEGASSLLLDGNSDYVSFPNITNLQLNAEDWTIEAFIRFASLPALGDEFTVMSMWSESVVDDQAWSLQIVTDVFGTRVLGKGAGETAQATITPTPSLNTWYHIAYMRRGNDIEILFNALREFNGSFIVSGTMNSLNAPLRIGVEDPADAAPDYFDGWIDATRITIGEAIYPDADTYTVPTLPYDPPVGGETVLGSAQISIGGIQLAASGTHLLSASIVMPVEVAANRVGETICKLNMFASISMGVEVSADGNLGGLRISTATISMRARINPVALYWYSDGTNLLGRATIQI